jgi:H+/Cl- antiporter ClcA
VEVLRFGERVARRIRVWVPYKGLIGGAALVVLALIFSNRYLGLGLDGIQSCLEGGEAPWYSFFVKSVFTSITLNFGGSGGIVTPIFFVGATSGALFAQLMHLNIGTFAAIGLVSVVAGAANTPIAASIMAVELFGPAIAPYATVACVISFLMTGHRSVYPSQILSFTKSASIHVDLGREMEDVEATYEARKSGVIGRVTTIVKMAERFLERQKKSRELGE